VRVRQHEELGLFVLPGRWVEVGTSIAKGVTMSPHRLMRRFVLLAPLLLPIACAEPPAPEEGTSADQVRTEDAVPEGAVEVLREGTASRDARDRLGVQRWRVFLVTSPSRDGLVGVAAYGVDQNDDVAYRLLLGADSSSLDKGQMEVGAQRWDANGVASSQDFTDEQKRILEGEMRSLGRQLAELRRDSGSASARSLTSAIGTREYGNKAVAFVEGLSPGARCALGVASGLLLAGAGVAFAAQVVLMGPEALLFLPVIGLMLDGTTILATGVPIITGTIVMLGVGASQVTQCPGIRRAD
jgi:hypothetical protein